MTQERMYVGIRRAGAWDVRSVESLTQAELNGVDLRRDVRATLVVGAPSLQDVATLLDQEHARGLDPFIALAANGHDCRGLELLRARVAAARDESRAERVRGVSELPELWALELSPVVRSLLHELQQARTHETPSLGRAGATLREALLRGLNELAREASVAEIDVSSEREVEGTHVSPVVSRPPSESRKAK